MALVGFVARHTGMPTLVPRAGRWPVREAVTGRVVQMEPDGIPVSDPLAPIGVPTRYVQAGSYVTLTRAGYGTSMITPADGHGPVAVDILGEDQWSSTSGVATAQTVGGPADRWPSRPDPLSLDIDLRTRGATSSHRLLEILRTPGRIVLLRDPSEPDVPDDDVAPVRVLTVTRAQASRTRSTLRATREWSLTATLRDGLTDATTRHRQIQGDGSPVVTWGEWRLLQESLPRSGRTYADVLRELAGMP